MAVKLNTMQFKLSTKPLLVAFLLAISTLGCFEPPNYSNTPEISFNSIVKFTVDDPFSGVNAKRDSVIITVDFKDGDGDLGETPDGRNNPRYSDWGNYELKTFRLDPNTKSFVELEQAANKTLFFPILKPNLKRGPIEGNLDFSPSFFYNNRSRLTVIKYQIRVRDRAFNVSNKIETDTLSVRLTY
ncbi:MAG: hypothetical protein EAZ70_10950 [Runella slithyformis]|nr:MAG: hypothetical protein EAY79_11390 [Runella slithyformis]TAE99331.1 MAG: hypothetical protein EAZ80_05055 [Runella slithyformis]TAF25002.1 MAG: hypothetical protein EAZ70_10950 [Runella slithyformis]TAF49811.1 MAG: hypothetical protein EAZ63_00290 [Runella slithyformis]TAF79588.1 MAG: hypothetical protein EAZ50_10835 [Runella slithyformis]